MTQFVHMDLGATFSSFSASHTSFTCALVSRHDRIVCDRSQTALDLSLDEQRVSDQRDRSWAMWPAGQPSSNTLHHYVAMSARDETRREDKRTRLSCKRCSVSECLLSLPANQPEFFKFHCKTCQARPR